MSHLEESGGRITLDWTHRDDHWSLGANAESEYVTVARPGLILTVGIPSVAVARKMAELLDRYAELRELTESFDAYADER